mmetsp:Transcript_150088/g.262115  ORF Transcript_150088/g.262115 Transcript_150088/m.262115 type:complete len:212 (-) Transcript_150088:450-1085(-)
MPAVPRTPSTVAAVCWHSTLRRVLKKWRHPQVGGRWAAASVKASVSNSRARCCRAKSPGMMVSRNGTRQPHSSIWSRVRSTCSRAVIPLLRKKAKLPPTLISEMAMPRQPCAENSARLTLTPEISPPEHRPWTRRKTASSTTPMFASHGGLVSAEGRQPCPTVATSIPPRDSMIALLRPYRSLIQPMIAPPRGRPTKVTAKPSQARTDDPA